ncbi:MAG: ANTAR domain-containing protein [Nocardioidaceae bacterium]
MVEPLVAGRPEYIGRYTVDVATERWWWSDTFFGILGFRPGEVMPSLAGLAAHLRPDAMDRGVEAMEHVFATGAPFTLHSRMVDQRGRTRTVLLAGHGEGTDGAAVTAVGGYLIDLTDAQREAGRSDVREALAGALDHRAVIEQAKGVLMVAHGVHADEAFELLRAYSQDSNIKVRDLAERLVELVARDGRPNNEFLRRVLTIFDRVA